MPEVREVRKKWDGIKWEASGYWTVSGVVVRIRWWRVGVGEAREKTGTKARTALCADGGEQMVW